MTAKRPASIYDDVSERDWQQQVLDLLEYHQWISYHTYDSRRSQPGFPDLVALHPKAGDILVLELKTERGKATPSQLQWLAWFEACGIDARLVRPSEIDGLIERIAAPQRWVRRPMS